MRLGTKLRRLPHCGRVSELLSFINSFKAIAIRVQTGDLRRRRNKTLVARTRPGRFWPLRCCRRRHPRPAGRSRAVHQQSNHCSGRATRPRARKQALRSRTTTKTQTWPKPRQKPEAKKPDVKKADSKPSPRSKPAQLGKNVPLPRPESRRRLRRALGCVPLPGRDHSGRSAAGRGRPGTLRPRPLRADLHSPSPFSSSPLHASCFPDRTRPTPRRRPRRQAGRSARPPVRRQPPPRSCHRSRDGRLGAQARRRARPRGASRPRRAKSRKTISSDPVAKKLLEWVILGSDDPGADFAALSRSSTPTATGRAPCTLRRKAEAAAFQERPERVAGRSVHQPVAAAVGQGQVRLCARAAVARRPQERRGAGARRLAQ